ncbi:P2Y purinoceptor 2 [Biomphalaria glabrata]|nr:P2Y purinoceptor 2 [Biomphalaria glabrata]
MPQLPKDSFMISDEIKFYFDLWFAVVATTCLASMSIVLNVINMAVFVKQGLKERVYFTLFCLSLVDLLGATSLVAVGEGLNAAMWPDEISAERLTYIFVFGWFRNMFSDLATALTVFLSIERCICVTWPFYFQSTSSFVARRPKIIIVTILTFVVLNYIPIFICIRFVSFQNEANNSTVFVLMYSDAYFTLQTFNDIVFGIILSAVCLVCVFVCAVVMYRGLRLSGEIRESSYNNIKDRVNGMSRRDREIVRMILVLSILYMMSSLPQILHCWTRAIIPDLATGDTMKLNRVIGELVIFMSATFGAFSFFIYFRFNKKFKLTLHEIILCQMAQSL